MDRIIKSYSEMMKLKSFEDRYNYLKLPGYIGDATFGGHRKLNQRFYKSPEWKSVREQVLIRDNGCDLAVEGMYIYGRGIIHHINPISINDLLENRDVLYDLENLVLTSFKTHNSIHYGTNDISNDLLLERKPNDTKPW